jgi:hypothetical protein
MDDKQQRCFAFEEFEKVKELIDLANEGSLSSKQFRKQKFLKEIFAIQEFMPVALSLHQMILPILFL